eukprot:CAMPEP_0113935990 /NCGR_PEP_ID=MMETSP1339-20121228/2996_1 /TAXON_ID=94617 /ORGANISM="Fibrocapsa japonica" /LENGTH=122 /DNA_ID=CAMNT_0000938303 /DNA_START=106 /DNA_END=474 /DNA_ORIENTATION=+ /assembly_acc=CAM_ASM_000762
MLSSIFKLRNPALQQCVVSTVTRGLATQSLKPLGDRVLVKRVTAKTQTAGGIYLPETKKDRPNEGEVVAVGPGARDQSGNLIPMDVEVGDKVLLNEYGGVNVKLDEDEFVLMRNDDILGKFA